MIDLSLLNENQRKAVLSDAKHLRIIAGAGSGKTRVLTMRIAYLIEEEDVRPFKILAITFTNKAANEMKERVKGMLESTDTTPWISTIHSLCVRILRQEIDALGYPKNFTIIDAEDQKSIVKQAMKALDIPAKDFSPGSVVAYISHNKTSGVSVQEAKAAAGNYLDDIRLADIYAWYIHRLKEMQALDFDDLILMALQVLSDYSEARERWQRRYEYILVDEFQDIDANQYQLIKLLAGDNTGIYVVGDPDQTIYTWRGADVSIIMDFAKSFPGAETIVLNENYRSTPAILNGANSVIKNNINRIEKELFTRKESDEKITHYHAEDDDMQAEWIAAKIEDLHAKGVSYNDIALLYRSNYLSRVKEKVFMAHRIPHVIFGGVRFYDRQEVKDALCYLRLALTHDDLAFERVVNRPKRGVGAKSLDTLLSEARARNITMYELVRTENPLSGKAGSATSALVAKAERWSQEARDPHATPASVMKKILDESGYMSMLMEENEDERIENVKALIQDINQYTEQNPGSTMDEYLQMISLYTDREEAQSGESVKLMTVHSAKGLEFDYVFVTDMMQSVFPNQRAMDDSGSRGMEEERRLAYVAFTRARKKLYLTETEGYNFIQRSSSEPSIFIKEIDERYIEHIGTPTRGYSSMPGSWGQRGTRDDRPTRTSSFMPNMEKKAKEAQPKKRPNAIAPGAIVTDVKYGSGIVVKVEGEVAEIAFKGHGIRKLKATHERLTVVSNTAASGEYKVKDHVVHEEYGNGVVVKAGDKLKIAFGFPIGVKMIDKDDPALRKGEE